MTFPNTTDGSAHYLDEATYRIHLDTLRDLGTIRLRNLLNYRERKHGEALAQYETHIVRAGNQVAHGGNSHLDAFLLSNPHHLQHIIDPDANERAFENMYRMSSAEVLQRADDPILRRALDQVGTINNRKLHGTEAEGHHRGMMENFEQLKGLRTGPVLDNGRSLNECLKRLEDHYTYLDKHTRHLKANDRFHAKDWFKDRDYATMRGQASNNRIFSSPTRPELQRRKSLSQVFNDTVSTLARKLSPRSRSPTSSRTPSSRAPSSTGISIRNEDMDNGLAQPARTGFSNASTRACDLPSITELGETVNRP